MRHERKASVPGTRRRWTRVAAHCLVLGLGTLFTQFALALSCPARYGDPAAMVDAAVAKYGTLYSGGSHYHQLDDIGATVDLYRLWRGLPDLQLRELGRAGVTSDLPWNYEGVTDAELSDALRLGTDADPGLPTAEARFNALVHLDLATATGNPPDWWMQGASNEMSASRRRVVSLSATNPFLDWLQFAVAASDGPWTYGRHLWDPTSPDAPAYERLGRAAMERYSHHGGVEWLVAAALFPGGDILAIEGAAREIGEEVDRCVATASSYAAFVAMMVFRASDRLRLSEEQAAGLSSIVQTALFKQDVLLGSWDRVRFHGWPVAAPTAFAMQADRLAMPEDIRAWAATFDTYSAATADDVIAIHADHPWAPKTIRALNLLPLASLSAYAKREGIASPRKSMLLRVSISRAFALGDIERGRALLEDLAASDRDQGQAIDTIRSLRVPPRVELALVVAIDPRMSTWLRDDERVFSDGDYALLLHHRGSGRDLPPELARGQAIQSDLETWWLLPQRWHRYHGMRGFSIAAIDRAMYANERGAPAAVAAPLLISDGREPSFGIDRWAAWEELALLAGSKRLSSRLADTLIDCAERPPPAWFRRSGCRSETMAQALHVLVNVMAREGRQTSERNDSRRAFDLLHREFPESEWTLKTPYWFDARL